MHCKSYNILPRPKRVYQPCEVSYLSLQQTTLCNYERLARQRHEYQPDLEERPNHLLFGDTRTKVSGINLDTPEPGPKPQSVFGVEVHPNMVSNFNSWTSPESLLRCRRCEARLRRKVDEWIGFRSRESNREVAE